MTTGSAGGPFSPTTPTITITVKDVDGEPMLDSQCMALLFGVEVAAVNALPFRDGQSAIPSMWIKRGRRRTREAQAHTGSTAMLDALEYWAAKDHGALLTVVYE